MLDLLNKSIASNSSKDSGESSLSDFNFLSEYVDRKDFNSFRSFYRNIDGWPTTSLVLYQLLKFISKSKSVGSDVGSIICGEEEKFYSNIVRSYMPQGFLYYVSIIALGESVDDSYCDYKKLLEKYSFFEHMKFCTDEYHFDMLYKNLFKQKRLQLHYILIDGYKPTAFGESDCLADFVSNNARPSMKF